MRYVKALLLTASLSAAAAASGRDASACGGCFIQQNENTQVSGHRMILSISQNSTSLWDQITYAGDPQEFAWVLPIKGQVDIGLSSDALFQVLEQATQVVVLSPEVSCGTGGSAGAGTGGTGGTGGGGVTIIDQQVVGPYETVQLSSADPQALTDWLQSHGYNLPADVKPVVEDYVAESFDFLALKLIPGKDVDSMRPVRVTSPGASPLLPLRMTAAGTGVKTPMSLWVVGEGRYQPKSFPWFLIEEKDLVWNWNTQSSNYSKLRQAEFDQSNGFAWIIDASIPMFGPSLKDSIELGGGLDQYADENGMNAQQNLDADMDALYGSLAQGDERVTHLFAELSRPALAKDLDFEASPDQGIINPYLVASQSVGIDPCGETGGGGGTGGSGASSSGGSGGAGANSTGGNNTGGTGGNNTGGTGGNNTGGTGGTPGGSGDCKCSVPGEAGSGDLALVGAGLAAAVAMSRRRRRAGG
jgi:MYXO-CTERM domain-containing protein